MFETTTITKDIGKGITYEIELCTHGLERCHKCCMDFIDMNEDAKNEAQKQLESLCYNPSCHNHASLLCSRCRLVRYCGTNCQSTHWKTHKKICKSNKKLRINLACGDYPDRFVDVLPIGTRVSMITGHADPLSGKIVSFNRGKGVYKNPEVKYHPKYGIDMDDMCTYTIKYDNGGTEKIICTDIYSGWDIKLPSAERGREIGDASAGLRTSTLNENPAPSAVPSKSVRVLVVTGLLFNSDICPHLEAISTTLRERDIAFDFLDFDKKSRGENVIASLASNNYSACYILSVGSAGGECWRWINSDRLEATLCGWVSKGGRLVLHGEGIVAKVFQEWFGKNWFHSNYHRTDYTRSPSNSALGPLISQFPETYNVKAVSLSGVKSDEVLYEDEGGCVVALCKHKAGILAFVGDVNYESSTMALVNFMCTTPHLN